MAVQIYPAQWIGRGIGAQVSWPARQPELNFHFFSIGNFER
jgi:hypothetical protein